MKTPKILFLLLFCFLTPSIALAQVLIEEGKVNLSVEPGETVTGSITVHNTGDKPLALRVYWQDFEYIPPFNGKKNFSPPGTKQNSLSQWVSFIPRQLDLPPFGKDFVKYTIKVPREASGGYYGVLFVEEGDLGTVEDMAGVTIIARVGSLFFVETKNSGRSASIQGLYSLGPGILNGNFENRGDVVLIPRGIYYLLDEEGLVTARGELEKFYLPPGRKTDFTIPLKENLTEGKYTMVLTFDLEGNESVVREIDFTHSKGAPLSILKVRK